MRFGACVDSAGECSPSLVLDPDSIALRPPALGSRLPEFPLLTAVAVARGRREWLAVNRSTVTFKPLTAEDIAAYIATGEPFGKAGAYGIQGPAAAFIAHISGSYSGIMGLPLYETAQLLRQAGLRF